MNQNGITINEQWTHEFFNSPSINASIYRQEIEKFLLNSYDWDSESNAFKNDAMNIFGNNWKLELSKAISWIGLEGTSGYQAYLDSYLPTVNKYIYIKFIRNKIENSTKICQ